METYFALVRYQSQTASFVIVQQDCSLPIPGVRSRLPLFP